MILVSVRVVYRMLLWCLVLGSLFATVRPQAFNFQSTLPTNLPPTDEVFVDDPYYPSLVWSDVFDWKILKVLSQNSSNILFSPVSLKLILAILYEASSGSTQQEFEDVLDFGSKEIVRERFKKMVDSLHENYPSSNYFLMNTRIFLDVGLRIKDVYARKLTDHYRTAVVSANFSDPERTSSDINIWAEKSSKGSVTKLTDPSEMKDMIMLLANIIYFKGTWTYPFPKSQTSIGRFYPMPSDTMIYLPYMVTVNSFYYFESQTLEAKMLRLPYQGSKFSMILVLPLAKAGLKNLVEKIDLVTLHQQLHFLDKTLVLVSIPKFSFKLKTSYVQLFKKLGIQKIFQNTASLTGVAQGNSSILRELVVSDVLQTTSIDVDEEGTVAFAATAVVIGNKIGVPNAMFNATHPFLFFIQDDTSGTILFIGTVQNPLNKELEIWAHSDGPVG
ncbi:serine protease inhibitor 2 [Euwallacea fornicatus]|uniref:serine protease inhibitor 2 n=1 Tax=Euwallacea fornicatus TaxID=995702 RepID=UPI00338D9A3C